MAGNKMWAGRTAGRVDELADRLNSSLPFDCRMYRQDITGSMAHAAMLGKQGIVTEEEAAGLIAGLAGILADLDSGELEFDWSCEDIHMFVEQVLTERIGDLGKKLHTARSRNDQVALDLRLHLMEQAEMLSGRIKAVIAALCQQAEQHAASIMPGYTHLQRAQPVTFGHHLMAYAMMLVRDLDRLADWKKRAAVSPIGCCALAGTTYDTDRVFEAAQLGLSEVARNSMDGVSDRDFCLELLSDLSILMAHLSRLAEELVLWSSWEFRFVELADQYTTGSSIMPQKKNLDMAELIRGKTGRVYGSLMALLTTMKGLPLAYNKDMQEDKEGVFDAIDTAALCLQVLAPMLRTMTARPDNMRAAAAAGFINATDLADHLTVKGMPFRAAYKLVGELVAKCADAGCTLETLPLEQYKAASDLFEEDLFQAIDLEACLRRRTSLGGPTPESVLAQIDWVKQQVK